MRANSPSHLPPTRAALLALALYSSSLPYAQDINIQDAVDSAAEALILLDVKASDCIAALDSGADSQALCDDFMSAIDGDVLARYIDQCSFLRSWRDDYVEQTVATDLGSDDEENSQMLRRLVAIEYTCGETTLQTRTKFVVTAFNRLRNNSVGSSSTSSAGSASIQRQLWESRFNALDDAERRRLLDAVQNQQRRSLRENERQFDALENELIRQQIQNANPPN